MRLFLMSICIALLTACQSLGYTKPETTEDRIGYAKATLVTTYQTIADLVLRERITKARGRELIAEADTAREHIKTAEALIQSGQPTQAQSRLQLALNILVILEAKLK